MQLVDLRRLEPVSMRRYLRVYQLAAPSGAGASHEQLLPPIAEHFVTLVRCVYHSMERTLAAAAAAAECGCTACS